MIASALRSIARCMKYIATSTAFANASAISRPTLATCGRPIAYTPSSIAVEYRQVDKNRNVVRPAMLGLVS